MSLNMTIMDRDFENGKKDPGQWIGDILGKCKVNL